jgi:hypothetical protein
MAMSDYASGRNISVKPVPDELMFFSFAKEFHWTPDQIRSMKAKDVEAMTTMLNVYNRVKNKEIERANKKRR